jgi:hypothetical protein
MARFHLNTPGVNRLMTDPAMRRWALGEARKVAAEAKRLAPVRTGSYRRSIAATVVMEDGRWTGRVNAHDWKALFVEFGIHGIRKSRVLGTALDVVGK